MDHNDWNARYATKELIWTGTANQFLVSEVSDLSPGRALDIACGEGRNAMWLADRGWNVTAVDFAKTGIDKGRALAQERGLDIEWVVSDVLSWQYPATTYDLIALMYLQVRWPDMERVLEKCRGALRKGGVLLVVGHDSSNIAEGYGGPQDASVLYTAQQVASVAGELEVQRAERVERVVTKGDETHIAWDCLARLRA